MSIGHDDIQPELQAKQAHGVILLSAEAAVGSSVQQLQLGGKQERLQQTQRHLTASETSSAEVAAAHSEQCQQCRDAQDCCQASIMQCNSQDKAEGSQSWGRTTPNPFSALGPPACPKQQH